MTATNMCYNFVGFGCSPPSQEGVKEELWINLLVNVDTLYHLKQSLYHTV